MQRVRRYLTHAPCALASHTLSHLTNLAWLGGNITAWATNSATSAPYQPVQARLHPEQLWPGTGETSLLIGAPHRVRYFHGCYSIGVDRLWGVNRRRKGSVNTPAALKSIRAARPDAHRPT